MFLLLAPFRFRTENWRKKLSSCSAARSLCYILSFLTTCRNTHNFGTLSCYAFSGCIY